MDRRTTPANDRVAASYLKGRIEAVRFTDGQPHQVRVPVTTIYRDPDRKIRDRELLFGDSFLVLEDRDGFSFGQSTKDKYCGYVASIDLSNSTPPTHFVSARSTHVYSGAGIKNPPIMALSFGSRLSLIGEQGKFAKTSEGQFLPRVHVREVDELFEDPVEVAELFLGTPYLWAGNSSYGIDCSGLIQAAFLACGIDCPGDSDLQELALGKQLPDSAETRRGDLFFWKGHVAMAVDEDRIIHANANTMSVAYEQIDAAVERIKAAGEGPVTSRRRI